jgi:hypothetical protein
MQATQDRVLVVLRAFRTIAFCEGCMALKLGALPREVHEALSVVGGLPGLQIASGQCSECLRRTEVVRALAA